MTPDRIRFVQDHVELVEDAMHLERIVGQPELLLDACRRRQHFLRLLDRQICEAMRGCETVGDWLPKKSATPARWVYARRIECCDTLCVQVTLFLPSSTSEEGCTPSLNVRVWKK